MATLMTMRIGTKVQALAAALALGASVLSFSAGAAQASPEAQTDRQILCPYVNRYGYLEYWAPGSIRMDDNHVKWVCGWDTQWHPYRTHGVEMDPPPGGGVLAP